MAATLARDTPCRRSSFSGSVGLVFAAIAFATLGPGTIAQEAPPPLVVIVNQKNVMDDLSLSDLRKIYFGEQKFWPSRERIVPLLPPRAAPEALELLVETVMELDVLGFRREWRSRVFRGQAVHPPVALADASSTVQAVFQSTSAIAVLPLDSVNNLERVAKIVTVDGRGPADPDYALRAR